MQSNKASKKTRKDVSEPIETASAKKHRKAATVNMPEATVQEPVSAPKAMAAAAGSNATAAIVLDPVGVDAAPVAKPSPELSQERVHELAYRFWLADGKPHGNHFEHWLRAERELGIRR